MAKLIQCGYFSVIQILREINFWDSTSSKNCHFDVYKVVKPLKLFRIAVFVPLRLVSRKILISSKISTRKIVPKIRKIRAFVLKLRGRFHGNLYKITSNRCILNNDTPKH